MCTTTATDICDRRYFHSNLKFMLKYKVSIRDEDSLQLARKGKIKTFVLRINYSLKNDLIVRVSLFVSKLSGISSICLTKKYNIPMYQRHGPWVMAFRRSRTPEPVQCQTGLSPSILRHIGFSFYGAGFLGFSATLISVRWAWCFETFLFEFWDFIWWPEFQNSNKNISFLHKI